MFQGVLLIILGALAIAFPLIGTIVVEQIFAALLLIAGGYGLAASLGRKSGNTGHRVITGIWAALTLVTGLLLLFQIGGTHPHHFASHLLCRPRHRHHHCLL